MLGNVPTTYAIGLLNPTEEKYYETQRICLREMQISDVGIFSSLYHTTSSATFLLKKPKKSVHLSIKLYILPYKNTIIQLVTFVFSVRIAYKCTIYFLLNGRDRPAQQSSSVCFVVFKVNVIKKREKIKNETMRQLIKRQGPVCRQDATTICSDSQLCFNPQTRK